MDYLIAFVAGGAICVLAQLVLDLGKLTPAHVMVIFVTIGSVLSGLGLYGPLIDWAGAGALIPLPSFGHVLVQGMLEEMNLSGWLGLLAGGFKASAMVLTGAVLSASFAAAVFNPKG